MKFLDNLKNLDFETLTKFSFLGGDRLTRGITNFFNISVISGALIASDYGEYAYFLLIYGLLDTVLSFGMPAILPMRISLMEKRNKLKLLFISHNYKYLSTISFFIIFFFASYFYNSFLNVEIFYLAIICVFFSNWSLTEAYFFSEMKQIIVSAIKIINSLLFLGIRIFLIYYVENLSLYDFILTYIFENLILSLCLIFATFHKKKDKQKNIFFKNNPDVHFFKNALTAWISACLIIFYMRIDQIIISIVGTREDLAIYAVAAQLSELSFTLPMVISALYVGKLGSIFKDKNYGIFELELMKTYRIAFFSSIMVLPLIFFIFPLLFNYFYPTYLIESLKLFSIMCFSLPFVALGVIHNISIILEGKPEILLKKTLFTSIIAIPVCAFGWIENKLYGLAIAIVFLQFFGNVLCVLLFNRKNFSLQIRAILLKN